MTAFLLLASFRFLSFNIWGDFFGNPPHERDQIEAGIVRKWHPDVAGFQEVTKNFWKSRLFSDLADEYEVIGRGLGPGEPPIDAFSPLIYLRSRFELVDVYPTDHGDPKRDAAGVYRGVPAGEAVGLRPEEMHLDHVFYDPERIVADRFSIDTTPEACGVSDHHPIVTDFRLVERIKFSADAS